MFHVSLFKVSLVDRRVISLIVAFFQLSLQQPVMRLCEEGPSSPSTCEFLVLCCFIRCVVILTERTECCYVMDVIMGKSLFVLCSYLRGRLSLTVHEVQ